MKAILKTLTPVHIGNGTTYNKNIDFLQYKDKIGIIDEKKVLDFIGTDNIHQWVAAIDKGGNAFIDLLKTRGWNESMLEKICSRIDNLRTADFTSTQLKEIYRTPLKGITIPGSSIKGAIKTAVYNSMMNDNERGRLRSQDLFNRNNKFDFSNLDKSYFGSNANEKSTRFLKVRDVFFEDLCADVYEAQILNSYHEGWSIKKGQQILVESLPENSCSTFDLIIDLNLLNANINYDKLEKRKFENNPSNEGKFYKPKWSEKKINFLTKGYSGLCRVVNNFTKAQIKKDYDTLKVENIGNTGTAFLNNSVSIYQMFKELGENEMILRIGGFSGYLYTTGQWVGMEKQLNNVSISDFNALRKAIQFNRERKDYSAMKIWPKTRKTTVEGELFGFVKISFE